ncbi:MAG: DUF2115 domain-containing protein [Methanobacteriota archaeon]
MTPLSEPLQTDLLFPHEESFSEDETTIRMVVAAISTAKTKGELGRVLAREVGRYTLHDLQVIGGRLHAELIRLPQPYRSRISPYLTEQIFGGHHQLVSMFRSDQFSAMTGPITDELTFNGFCEIIPIGCTQWDEADSRLPVRYTTRHRLFYYLIAAFMMFVLERPGHPVGTPFPGGYNVEERNGSFYCLIRDHEKEVPFSICNFCPALQSSEDPKGSSW